MTVELTDEEAAHVVAIVRGAPVTGNLEQLRQYVAQADVLIAKLTPPKGDTSEPTV